MRSFLGRLRASILCSKLFLFLTRKLRYISRLNKVESQSERMFYYTLFGDRHLHE